jgi:glycosyltransferase involved in cell wall biosynthesis
VVHGDGLRRLAAAHYAKPLERVHVVPHPAITRYADLARRLGLRRRADGSRFTLLMFGRIFAYKGLAQLIRAEALLGDRVANLRIVIAGRGDDPWALADRMGDRGRYEVRNAFIEDREVAQLFLDADAVALPYVEASQSGVLNVAAAFGKPVVASDVGELGATVAANGLGLVVPAGDPAALAAAIAELAVRPDLARAFGANARAWAEGPNAPDSVGAATVALYREILDRSLRVPRRAARPEQPAAETAREAEPC